MSAAAPIPQGHYVPATRHGDVIHTAGMTPRDRGVLTCRGPVTDAADPALRAAVELACGNALTAARGLLDPGEALSGVLSMTVYVAAAPGFEAHSQVADLASDHLFAELGSAGIGSRAAVGVASLPGGAAVEIALIATVAAAATGDAG